MKIIINLKYLWIPVLMLATALVACESQEQKPDAFDTVKQKKLEPTSEVPEVKAEVVPPREKMAAKKPILDEWSQFNLETGKKLLANEARINAMKIVAAQDTKLLRKVERLEKDNNDLRKEMNLYAQEVKERWETFKTKMDQGAGAIDIELKDLAQNNKK